MANKICAAFYIVFCSYLFVANVVNAERRHHLACAAVPDGTFVRSAKSCGYYYLCKNEAIALEGACPHGYLFDEVKQICGFGRLVNCNSCAPYGRPNIADPKSCRTYFKCVNGIRRTYHCPTGQLFDDISNRCQASRDVDCKVEFQYFVL